MRRLSSIMAAVALTATGLTITSSAASAASGTATVKRSTTAAPSSIAAANASRTVRLAKTNQTLAIGFDSATAGTRLHLWKINDDATIDTKFGAVDLGAESAAPTSSNSSCVSQNLGYCFRVDSFTVNENADRFIASWTRSLNGSGSSANNWMQIQTIAVGKISTGEVVSSLNFANATSGMNMADWSQYNPTNLASTSCSSVIGATHGGIPLAYSYFETFGLAIRPDGSLLAGISCDYNNTMNGYPASVVQHRASMLVALKTSGTSLVVDTSFGTNGYLIVFNDTSTCGWSNSSSTVNSGITSNTSTALFAPLLVRTFPRQTSVPSWMQNQNVTSYNGCDSIGVSTSSQTARIIAIQANGVVKSTTTYPSGTSFFVSRWIIDPQGRWNAMSMGVGGPQLQAPSQSFIRLLPDGKPDTSIGANGMKVMTTLPSTITVNGTSVMMSYQLLGFATTAKGIVFSGISTSRSSSGTCQGQQASNDFTTTMYPYYLSLESGLDTTYGTNGLGEGVKFENSRTETCGSSTVGRTTYINSKGQPGFVGQVLAVGSQTRGLLSVTWNATTGVTSGGEGVGAVVATNRVDTKVHSTRLPAVTQPDSALTVLTAKQSKDLDIRTSTPKICIALTTSVMMVNPGRCVVRIIDEDTKRVLRTMTTTVKKAEVEAGTTLTTDEPIMFKQANIRLSKTALAQVAELVEAAKTASRVVVIGHSAALGDVSAYSFAISRDRANAVKAALIKAGVKVPIETVALSYSQPETTKKTEAAQAKNRRAEVFIFP